MFYYRNTCAIQRSS